MYKNNVFMLNLHKLNKNLCYSHDFFPKKKERKKVHLKM